jgi:hypothetical protein
MTREWWYKKCDKEKTKLAIWSGVLRRTYLFLIHSFTSFLGGMLQSNQNLEGEKEKN